MSIASNDASEAVIAWRKYEVGLRDGSGSVAITLLNPMRDSAITRHAIANGAMAFGLMTHPLYAIPLLWEVLEDRVTVTPQNNEPMPDDHTVRTCAYIIATFFDDIRDVAPGLAELDLTPAEWSAGDRCSHAERKRQRKAAKRANRVVH